MSPTRFHAAAALILAVGAATPALAQKRPDFSGTYTLVADKSDFGPMPAPAGRTDVIDHKDPKIVIKRIITTENGDANLTLDLAVDGKPHKNPSPQGDLTSTLSWEGETLVINTTLDSPQGPVTLVDRMTLSADGKTITQKRAISVGGQELAQTIVLAKQ